MLEPQIQQSFRIGSVQIGHVDLHAVKPFQHRNAVRIAEQLVDTLIIRIR